MLLYVPLPFAKCPLQNIFAPLPFDKGDRKITQHIQTGKATSNQLPFHKLLTQIQDALPCKIILKIKTLFHVQEEKHARHMLKT